MLTGSAADCQVSGSSKSRSRLGAVLTILLLGLLATTSAQAQVALFRVNAGGDAQAAGDGGIGWDVDTGGLPSTYHVSGSNSTGFTGGTLDVSVPGTTPAAIFDTERWDPAGGNEMNWSFPVGSPVPTRSVCISRMDTAEPRIPETGYSMS